MFSLSLYALFDGDGRIAKNDGSTNTQLLILGIILAVVWCLLTVMYAYYIWQFKKVKAQAKMFNWPLIGLLGGLNFIVLICWVLNLPFYLKAESIFGLEHASTAFSTVVALYVIGYVALVAIMVVMWFFISQFGVAFEKDQILFIGEKISNKKITKIVKDENKGAIYINFMQGTRTHKRQKFYLQSVLGQFVLKNAKLTGHEVEVEDENAYFKKAVTNTSKSNAKTDKKKTKKVDK